MNSALATSIATWFGCGYFPYGPGTVGSLAALLMAAAMHRFFAFGPLAFLWLASLLLAPAVWSAERFAVARDQQDPQQVVVDEVVGQWISIAGASALNWKSWTAAFVLFRIFDIWKPFPVRRLERLHGGLGIVADDAMAGIYAALVLWGAGWFNLY